MRAAFSILALACCLAAGPYLFPPACLGAFRVRNWTLTAPGGTYGIEQYIGRGAIFLHLGPLGGVSLQELERFGFGGLMAWAVFVLWPQKRLRDSEIKN